MATKESNVNTEEVADERQDDFVKMRDALVLAVNLLDNAKPDYLDPALRREWGQQRKQIKDMVAPWR